MIIFFACGSSNAESSSTDLAGEKPTSEVAPVFRFSENDLTRFLSLHNETKIRHAIHEAFAKISTAEMVRLQSEIEKITSDYLEKEGVEDDHVWLFADEFYRHWGEIAPQAAFAALKIHESYWANMNEAVYYGWAIAHPDDVTVAYKPSLERQYSSSIRDAVLEALAVVDPAKALHFADEQEIGLAFGFQTADRDEIFKRNARALKLLSYVFVEPPSEPTGLAIHSWMLSDPEGALTATLALKYNSLKTELLEVLFSRWILKDSVAAIAAFPLIQERYQRENTINSAMQAYLFRHPFEALENILELPTFENEGTWIYGGPMYVRFTDSTGLVTSGKMSLLTQVGAAMGLNDGEKAWKIASAIGDEQSRANTLGGVMAGWLLSDLDTAIAFTKKGFGDNTFPALGGKDFPDYAAKVVAKTLAEQDFPKATEWVKNLPETLQNGALSTVVQIRLDTGWNTALHDASPDGWVSPEKFLEARQREFAPVMDWLASLPPSKGRDDGLNWLVFKLSDFEDLETALKFAAMISDAKLRRISLASLAKIISERSSSPLNGTENKSSPEKR